jgi:hypothetical protein
LRAAALDPEQEALEKWLIRGGNNQVSGAVCRMPMVRFARDFAFWRGRPDFSIGRRRLLTGQSVTGTTADCRQLLTGATATMA